MIRELTSDEMFGTLQILVRANPTIFGRLSALELFELFYDIELKDFAKGVYQLDGFLDKITDYWQNNQAPVLTPIIYVSQNSKS